MHQPIFNTSRLDLTKKLLLFWWPESPSLELRLMMDQTCFDGWIACWSDWLVPFYTFRNKFSIDIVFLLTTMIVKLCCSVSDWMQSHLIVGKHETWKYFMYGEDFIWKQLDYFNYQGRSKYLTDLCPHGI